ncbi:MAG: hypothetical protein IJH90_06960 [Mogibacterium sp.]|nr:hypothetical protein [Mogibacterium sp.]
MKKGKFGAFIAVLIALLLIGIAGTLYYLQMLEWHTEMYAAGTTNTVAVYGEDGAGGLAEAGRLVRGNQVNAYQKKKVIDGIEYVQVQTDAELITDEESSKTYRFELYMRTDELTESPDDVVREKERYVRTPVTIYAEAEGPAIASFAPKGTCLAVTGYDEMDEMGNVHKYRVKYGEGDNAGEGYVYSKYLVTSQEAADAVYNENGETDAAAEDEYGFDLYGGHAKNLDYYPYERPVIEGNEFCKYARAMYLNGVAAVNPDSYINIIKKTDCNAVVMDIKDGYLAYQSEVAKEISPTSYRSAYSTVETYRKGVDKLRETGVYLIGRIVVFNDPEYAKDHPKDCIKYNGSSSWPSAYSRNVWEYNVRLAQEAIREFGFNEIQFDYVRFPEATYNMSKSGKANFRNTYKEEKGQAIQNFCFYAADQIHEAGAYFSVDVFGESVYGYMTAYGQYWPALSNIVDAISAMPYTDHTGGEGAWKKPYDTMKNWGKRAKKMQDRLSDPAVPRTWITGYNTPYWAPTENYNEAKLKSQINGLEEAGLRGGFIPWNALSDVDKYNQYKGIWNEKN